MKHEVVQKKAWHGREDEGMGQGNVNAGVASVRRAEGFVAGATPLLTGTLSSHPSNRTVYSGLKPPPHSVRHTRKRMVWERSSWGGKDGLVRGKGRWGQKEW